MAVAASLLRNEMRRHLLMNLGLVASCVVGGTVVTNERGLFVPLGIHSMSETAKAFAAMFTPSHLLPGFVNVQSVVPLEPFDVMADSRDLRRRLMESVDSTGGIGGDIAQTQTSELQAFNGPPIPVQEYAQNAPNATSGEGGGGQGGGSSDGGSSGGTASGGSSDGGAAPGGVTNTSTGNNASNGALNNSGINNVGSTLASTNDDTVTTNVTTPIDNGGGNTTPVPEPSMWLMMLAGFGAVGYRIRAIRRRKREAEEDAELGLV